MQRAYETLSVDEQLLFCLSFGPKMQLHAHRAVQTQIALMTLRGQHIIRLEMSI